MSTLRGTIGALTLSLLCQKFVITVELFSIIIHGTMDELANGNCTDLSSHRQFSVTAPLF
jgi:hypothetical protein